MGAVVDGKKSCSCPLHNGELIPVNRFRLRKPKKRTSARRSLAPYREARCRAWHTLRTTGKVNSHRKGDLKVSGLVPLDPLVLNVAQEIVFRVGLSEAAREIGIARNNLTKILRKERKHITAETLRRAIATRNRLREENIALSRADIKRGTLVRGETLRPPTRTQDFNGMNDGDAFRKRGYRRQDEKARGKLMRPGLFLCGCNPQEVCMQLDPNWTIHNNIDDDTEPGLVYVTTRDDQGYEICPLHRSRLYGWRNIMVRGPQGNEIHDHRAEYLRDYGKAKALNISPTKDQRDNRDPEQVGLGYLSKHK